MKILKTLAILILLSPAALLAQSTGALQGHSYLGGTQASTSGMKSANYLDGIIPHATITVYLTGTTTLATIYADGNNTPLSNPFTSNALGSVNPGGWIFFSATNQGVDVVGSGGISPNTYPSPVTLCKDCYPSSSFSPVSGVTSVSADSPIEVNDGAGPATGAVTVSCPMCGSGNLVLQVVPPASGQYVVLYPNAVTPDGPDTCNNDATASASSPYSGSIVRNESSSTTCSGDLKVTWNGVTLPSYITASNVTAIYGGFVSRTNCTLNSTNNCGFFGETVNTVQVYPGGGTSGTGTYTTELCSSSCGSFDYATVEWIASNSSTLNWIGTGPYGGTGTFLPILIVYYTGTAPPANNQVQVAPPLNYNQDILSLTIPYDAGLDTGSSTAYAVSLPGYSTQLIPGTEIKFTPANSSTTTTPTLALNGGTGYTIEGPSGSALQAGDVAASHIADVIYDPDGKWRLQNPQVSGGGTPLSLTTTGTSGAAALSDNVLNIPEYQGALTLTTTGTSGAATLSGNTLNIPEYSGGGTGTVPANIIYASEGNGTAEGCTLNSNLLTGGGTDATDCLQTQLDWLGSNGGGELILNGPALISNAEQGTTNSVDGNVQTTCLQTHSNVTIYVPTGGGVFLAASSNCAMLGNNITGNPSATFQTGMRVIGGFWNGNNANQSKYEQGNSANQWNFGFWFGGFNGLEISNVTLYNVATFNFNLSNGENFVMSNDTATQTTTVPGVTYNEGGINFWGTISDGVVNNFTDNGGDDDPIAFNTDEGVNDYNGGGSSWENARNPNSGGATSNIVVNGLTLTATNNVYRFIGYTTTNGVATLNNIALRNVSGTYTGVGVNNSGVTSCTNILIDNWTPTDSGTIANPNLGGSSCTITAGQTAFGTVATVNSSSSGRWNFLSPGIGDSGNYVGLQLGTVLNDETGYVGALDFVPALGANDAFWRLGIPGDTKTLNWYGTGDLSLTSSDCASAFRLPTSGGIEQASGGSSSTCYTTAGGTTSCSGTSVDVNGSAVSSPNFNGTTPTAPSGAVNNTYQVSSSSVSSYTPAATGSTPGVITPDGTTCTVSSGVLTCTGSSGGASISICADTSGSGTAQSCTTSPSFTPVAGSVIAYTTSTANSGTGLTINVNSLGAKSVAKWQTTTTLAANDIRAGTYVLMTYDGTNWEASAIGNAPSGGGGSGNYVNLGSTVSWSGCTYAGGACTVSGSAAASITISSIPGTYLNLILVFNETSTTSTNSISATFNGDTTSGDYAWICQQSPGPTHINVHVLLYAGSWK